MARTVNPKSRGNWKLGMCLPTCKCPSCKRNKKDAVKNKSKKEQKKKPKDKLLSSGFHKQQRRQAPPLRP